ncbi:hypothetical protein [Phenylobacterium sp.]|uniref:hypothetical protein n=1 Tax=Phenylobacterium sp. TaxID=1871053 RepID=UPI002899144D|nr:hypothetical protein [Phenylobacterium sp.]
MEYRLYVLNSAGKFADVEEWDCASDPEALERAAGRRHAFGAELWQGKRHLSTFAGPIAPSAEDRAA